MVGASPIDIDARALLLAWTLDRRRAAPPHVMARALEMAAGFALSPRAAAAVLKLGTAPTPLADAARDDVSTAVVVQSLALRELADLVALLDTDGIRTVVIKGGAMLARGIVAPGGRHMDDIDVLVDPSRAHEIDRILDGAAWERIDWAARPGIDGRPLAEHGREDHHALIPRIAPGGSLFDLHRSLPDVRALAPAEFDALHIRSTPVDVHGAGIHCMAPADLVATICHHVIVHHRAEPRYLGRHLADLVDLERAMGGDVLDRRPAAPVPSADTSRRVSRLLLDAARREDERGSPGPWSPLLLPVGGWAVGAEQLWHGVALGERLAWDLRHRPEVLLRKLAPSRAYVADEFGIDPTSPWLPLCYAARLVTVPLAPLWKKR